MVLGHLDGGRSVSIAVAHTNDSDIGEHISKRIKKDFHLESVLLMNAAPVLGAHTGSGASDIAIHNHSFAISDDTLND